MRRVTFFESTFETLIAGAQVDDRVRWYAPGDREILLARSLELTTLDWFLNNGGRIAVMELDGQVVGWNMYSFVDEPHYGWLLLRLPSDAVYASTSYVMPSHRGHQTVARLKAFTARSFMSEGYKRLLSTVDDSNIASMKAHAFVGARKAAVLRIIKLHRYRAVFRDGGMKLGCWNEPNPYLLDLDDRAETRQNGHGPQ